MFAYCLNNPANMTDFVGLMPRETALIGPDADLFGGGGYGSVPVPAPAIPLEVLIYLIFGGTEDPRGETPESKEPSQPESPEDKKPKTPNVTYPGDDPEKAPDGYEWRGKGIQGSKEGGYANPKGKDSWHPDLHHPDGIDPHWDYNDGMNHKWRVFPDKIELVK